MTDPVPASRRPHAPPASARDPAGRGSAARAALGDGVRRGLVAGGLALIAAACGPASDAPDGSGPGSGSGAGRTVLLISLDTLRPERMGVYGGAPDVSPNVDALAADGVVFDQALAPAPWTLPSHMTMLTGLDPVAHGVHNGGVKLSRHVDTLAELLRDAGFDTAAFTDGGFVSGFYGFEQGFDVYEDERSEDGPNGMRRVAPAAVEWLAELDADDDAFLFVHSFDAHSPYDSPEPRLLERFRARGVAAGEDDHAFAWLRHLQQQVKVGLTGYHRMAQLMNDYDAGVHQADLGVGRLVQALRDGGRYDDALVIVTSDHGEAFFEHDLHIGHGLSHRDNELHVPLVVKLPRSEAQPRRHGELVGLVDIARTVLDSVGVEASPEMQGESLLGLLRGDPRRNDWLLGWCNNSTTGWVIKGRHRYVTPTAIQPMKIAIKHLGPDNPPDLDPRDDEGTEYEYGGVALCYDEAADPLGLRDVLPATEELYDRAADPAEQHDVAAAQPELTDQMREFYLARYAASDAIHESLRDHEAEAASGTNASANLDRQHQRQLEALGYVGDQGENEAVAPSKRRWINRPHVAPDTAALIAADRRVHVVRAALLDGQPAPGDAAAVLQAAGADYVAWAMANSDHASRVQWRLAELETLATLAGAALDTSAWR